MLYKKIMKKIIKILVWPFEHLGEIFIISLVFACITLIEIYLFKIPNIYGDKIWLGNVILSIAIYIYSKHVNTKKYEELLDNLKYGTPTKDEYLQYKNELQKILDKYSGEEAFKKQREFIIKKRMEITLKSNGLIDNKN